MPPITFNFKGLMAPVLTFFKYDKDKSINVSNVPTYAAFLKRNEIRGVLIHGSTGEGTLMNVEERKANAEAWFDACQKNGFKLMVQVGGAPFVDVLELTEHAECLKADAILCLPELYFKPKTVQELVSYMKLVGEHCPNTPLLYYHHPKNTDVNLHMPTFCDLAEKEIPNFVGLKYTSGDLEQGVDCLKPGRNVFLGVNTILSAAMTLGFDSAIISTLNICPDLCVKIVKAMEQGSLSEAQKTQKLLSNKLKQFLVLGGGDWISSMKLAFNSLRIDGLDAGPARFLLKK